MSFRSGYDAGVASDARDDWMKRTGPFFPLLVAFRLNSALPIAADLEPSDDDLRRASPWIMGVALLFGGALALVTAVLLWSPLVPAIAATLLVAVATFATGAFAERGLVDVVGRLSGGEAVSGSGYLLAAVLIRLGLLLGTAPSAWPAALVVAAVVGKIAYLVVERPPWDVDGDPDRPRSPIADGMTPSRWAVVGVAALLAAVAFYGAWGAVALLLAVVVGAFARSHRERVPLAGVVGACEVLALILVAATSPATVSPLVAP